MKSKKKDQKKPQKDKAKKEFASTILVRKKLKKYSA